MTIEGDPFLRRDVHAVTGPMARDDIRSMGPSQDGTLGTLSLERSIHIMYKRAHPNCVLRLPCRCHNKYSR